MPPMATSDSQSSDQQNQSLGSSSSSGPSTSFLKERRFKLSRACDRCRRRRIKCDEGHPCQACLTANSACTFEEPGKRTHPHKSKRTATLEDRMHHLETLIQAIPPAVFAANGMVPPTNLLGKQPATSETPTSPIQPFVYPTQFPSGVPPPSLHVFPLTNPSTHFGNSTDDNRRASISGMAPPFDTGEMTVDQLAEETSRMSLSASYLYFDDEGYTRWQGETSGLPVLDLLVERHAVRPQNTNESPLPPSYGATPTTGNNGNSNPSNAEWFPDRVPRRTSVNPQALWRLMTSYIVPELMDSLVQCYLSTSYYILPFLHVPSFLADYGNPNKWGEPGFAAFIVAICCLASRHVDDPRVRTSPGDGITAGTQWFELFGRLRTLPIADRPTLYNIQANLIAAVYAVGLGKLSRAASLLAEATTMCIDAGLHRSADTYDLFDPIEDEVRKRTFWCVYIWDKQMCAHFGRPSMIRLRDCDVGEPLPIDDEFITKDGIGSPPAGTECRLSAFVCSLRIMVVLESVLNVPPTRNSDSTGAFLNRAATVLSASRRMKEMRDEESLLDEIHRSIPAFWAHTPETLASEDTIRLTQAERLHCAEHFVRLLIYRHRFSELMAERTSGGSEELPGEKEKDALVNAQNSALQIIATHLQIAKKGLMTYYGVHVIHQLTQAGRTLVAILLSCKTEDLQHLIPPGLDALRSCVGLLRRFSGRYVCGLRSGDLMEEFCRLTQIPLETNRREGQQSANRPPWIRPVRKKAPSVARSTHSTDSPSHHSSPEAFSPSDFYNEVPKPNAVNFSNGAANGSVVGNGSQGQAQGQNVNGISVVGVGVGGVSVPASSSTFGHVSGGPGGVGVGVRSTNEDQQQQQQQLNSQQHQSPNSFNLDHSGLSVPGLGLGMQDDSSVYMLPPEMMALFDDSVDMQQLFGGGFLPPGPLAQSPEHGHHMGGATTGNGEQQHFGDSPTFLKHGHGLATSP